MQLTLLITYTAVCISFSDDRFYFARLSAAIAQKCATRAPYREGHALPYRIEREGSLRKAERVASGASAGTCRAACASRCRAGWLPTWRLFFSM